MSDDGVQSGEEGQIFDLMVDDAEDEFGEYLPEAGKEETAKPVLSVPSIYTELADEQEEAGNSRRDNRRKRSNERDVAPTTDKTQENNENAVTADSTKSNPRSERGSSRDNIQANCFDFLVGKCKRNDCPRPHVQQVASERESDEDRAARLAARAKEREKNGVSEARGGRSRSRERVREKSVSRKRTIDAASINACFEFKESGKCKFGVLCKYRHGDDMSAEQERLVTVLTAHYEEEAAAELRMERAKRERERLRERERSTRDRDRRGDMDRDRDRDRDRNRDRSGKDEAKNPCFEFRREGSCKFGDTCRYLHDKAPVSWAPPPKYGGRERDEGEKKYSQDSARRQDQGLVALESIEWNQLPSCYLPAAQQQPVPSVDSKAAKKEQVCQNYVKGTCKRDQKCPYSHDAQPNARVEDASSASAPASTGKKVFVVKTASGTIRNIGSSVDSQSSASYPQTKRQKTNSENDDRRQQPVIHTKVVTSFSSSAASSSASNGAPTADAAKAETSIIQRVVKTSAKH